MKKLLFTLSFALLLVACGEETATVIPDEFKQLEKGMSYDEVQEIVGGNPKNPDEKENEDLLLFSEYDGENGIEKKSSVSLVYKDGKLDSILENGLMKEREELTKEQKDKIAENISKITNEKSLEKAVASVVKSDFEVKAEDGLVRIDINDKDIHEGSKNQLLKKSAEIFAELSKIGSVQAPSIYWNAPLTDQYGNEEMGEVLSIMMDGDTFKKVNWDNYEALDLEAIAPGFKQHDTLKD